ncbi:DUF4175 domain-containing protein [Aliiroseovarius crassostreae]|uniref:DUF4175 domain-containing protein n=1 Tax=Aliiroseovarius crassostreae TaxID=154981 RepID=UPI0022007D07|nr:DUF4175 domain-containing protein [Aliiroseovarius crassostreae]UWQ07416.1 DUF4175 domain-containing protein [Aliiroseovarius crassostreae]
MARNGARPPLPPELARQLRWPLRLTKAAIGAERGWRAFWPLATVAMAAVTWARFVGFGSVGFAALGVSFLIALVWGIRRFHPPSDPEAEARLDSTLPHAALATLRDMPALETTETSQILWQAHQGRMIQLARTARAPWPNLRIAERDPFALRLIAALGCVMALGFVDTPNGMGMPQADCPECEPTASWEGWIEPPAYTGQPSLYLNDQPPGPLPVPAGSRLTLRLYGQEQGGITLGGDLLQGAQGDGLQAEITENSTLSIHVRGAKTTPAWRFTAIGDVPPSIRTDGALTRVTSGTFKLGYRAGDDYGVTAGQARLELALNAVERRYGLSLDPDPRVAEILDLPRPYRADPRQLQGLWTEDLAQHPWAGLPVTVTLSAFDAIGQTGRSDPLHMTLPARRFFTPEARAVIEMRRDLLWARAGGPRVAQMLRAILHRPEDLDLPDGSYLALRAAIRDLEGALATGMNAEAQERLASTLWEIAIKIEEDGADSARDRMLRAQERLQQAMRDGATPEELAELMDELRRATQDYLDRLAQIPQDELPPMPDGDLLELSFADLDAMMDQIDELMQEGRFAEAMEMLDALNRMMENMQVARGQGERANQRARDGLADTLRQQQGLSDEAFRELQEQGGEGNELGESQGNTGRDGQLGRGQAHSGESSPEGAKRQGRPQGAEGAENRSLSQRQRSLEQELDAQRRALPGAGSEAGNAARDALDQAGRAMDQAADALEQGDNSAALDRQAEAMEALREGLRRFDEAMDSTQAGRDGQQGQTGQESTNPNARDPLGRATGNQLGRGPSDGGFTSEEDMRKRAQELTEELRNRAGETNRPKPERDYFERLLDQF